MIASAVVTIVLNGAIVASFAPARIVAGRVVGPFSPIVTRIAAKSAYLPNNRTIVLERDDRRIIIPVLFIADDTPYVELGSVVRALGGTASFDTRAKTLDIVLTDAGPLAAPVPYDPASAQVPATVVFTPEPTKPSPRAAETGIPRPRRTAIPAVPSQPVIGR